MTLINWLGIGLCILQSGIFSGLNLAVFGASQIQLQAKAGAGSRAAAQLLAMRKDSNFLLTTILWGNVSTNVLLTLLSDSVMAGVSAFLFSTFVITLGGEILPQAYFSRHALQMASLLRPVLRFWQIALYPLAKPTALLLDAWLGREGLQFLRERELREAIKRYTSSPDSEISRVEGIGVLNFLSVDDILISEEGEHIDPRSILEFPVHRGRPVFPAFQPVPEDPLLKQIEASGRSWVIIISPEGNPVLALDADGFLRAATFSKKPVSILSFCHRPIVVTNGATPLGDVLPLFKVEREREQDDVIDDDLILYWGEEKKVITGADLLGRLMRGIATTNSARPLKTKQAPGQ